MVVDHELPRRQRDQQPVVRIHLGRDAIDVIGVEPTGVTPDQARRDPLAHGGVPDDLGVRPALADGVEHVDDLVLQLVALEPVTDEVGLLDLVGVSAGGLDGDLQLGDGKLSRAEGRRVLRVLLLHLLGQLEIADRVVGLGPAQDRGEPLGRQALGRMAGQDRAHAHDLGAGDLLPQHPEVDRAAVHVDEARRGGHQKVPRLPRSSPPIEPHWGRPSSSWADQPRASPRPSLGPLKRSRRSTPWNS